MHQEFSLFNEKERIYHSVNRTLTQLWSDIMNLQKTKPYSEKVCYSPRTDHPKIARFRDSRFQESKISVKS